MYTEPFKGEMTQVSTCRKWPLTAVSFPVFFVPMLLKLLNFSDLAPPFQNGLLAQLVQSAALTGQRSLVRAQYNPHQAENPRVCAWIFSFRVTPSSLERVSGMKKVPPPLLRRRDFLFAEGRLHLVHRHPTKADGGNPVCEIPNSKFQIPNTA